MVKLVKLRSCCKGFEDLYVVPGDVECPARRAAFLAKIAAR